MTIVSTRSSNSTWPGYWDKSETIYVAVTGCSQHQIFGNKCYRYFRRGTQRYYYQTQDIEGDVYANDNNKAQAVCRSLSGGGNLSNPTSKKQLDFVLTMVPTEE